MDIPTVSPVSLAARALAADDSFITVAYEFTSGSAAELIPVGTSDAFPITGPSGEIEIPLGPHRKLSVRTPDMTTKVVISVLSSR